MKAKKLIVFSLIVLFILSLAANIYLYNEDRRLENEKILLSNGYIEKHAEFLRVRIRDVENIDIANDLVQLEKFIRACEESTMYYQVSVQPLQGKKSLIKGFNNNLLTVSEYRMRIDRLRGYYHSKLSGETLEEVTAKDVEMIISDFKTISNWLQERMKVKQMYYYDDGEFETEVLPQFLWRENKDVH